MAAFFGLLGLLWRWWLSGAGTPPTNSDEATMGLAALHIGAGRGLPVYFYGQHYMGTIEAYLAAPLVLLLGPTVTALRIVTLALYAAYLVLAFVFVRRVYSPGLAVLTVALLAFGADRTVKNQLIAGGGYPETPAMVLGLLLITWLLATRRWERPVAYAGWGLLFGLIAWNHWLPAPFLLGALVLLIAAKVFTARRALSAAAGFVVGLAPLLVDNLTAPLAQNSVSVFLGLNGAGSDASLWERLVGGVWLSVPLGMGLCAPGRCEAWSLWWSPVFLALVVVALVMAVSALRRRAAARRAAGAGPVSAEDRDDWARDAMSLVLLGAGLLSLLSYVRSPAAADTPIESARYLAVLLLVLPAALWPLWRRVRLGGARGALAAVPVAALALTMLAASASLLEVTGDYGRMRDDNAALLAGLRDRGYSYVHAGYWTCNWISYLSDEKVLCGVVGDDLNQGLNRYPSYWHERPQAWVAEAGSALDVKLAQQAGPPVFETGGYRVYPAPAQP
ncbi:hypothetical protein Cs7R123_73090 [Catellatospora sp. TT07R-123]|uniref:hypothetical protein n=1 Tax=Catellatospora sp. TT07R-123 TaxID=2733863 RepID=UPI001B0F70A2|nr:hypothetical protein [Catellatospora sp. TT07R-123]GHJ49967.1 hypothetical protein Cs7R123_73090 [Catellatospora sp. TT07R-123]